MIEDELRSAANGVSLYHIMNARKLQREAGLIDPEEEELVTMQRFESPPPTSSESKTSADEKEENRRNAEKEKAYQRKVDRENQEEQ